MNRSEFNDILFASIDEEENGMALAVMSARARQRDPLGQATHVPGRLPIGPRALAAAPAAPAGR